MIGSAVGFGGRLLRIGSKDLEIAGRPDGDQRVPGAAAGMAAAIRSPDAKPALEIRSRLLEIRRGVDQVVDPGDQVHSITTHFRTSFWSCLTFPGQP